MVQENKKLKRQSQLLVQSMNSVDLSMLAAIEKEADTATENGTANTEDQTEHFNTMIEGKGSLSHEKSWKMKIGFPAGIDKMGKSSEI